MDSNKTTRIIVFEGPDKCGKSTQLEKTKQSLIDLGYNVATTKFPEYTGILGDTILEMLCNPSTLSSDDNKLPKGFLFGLYQVINKISSLNWLYNLYYCNEKLDFILIDRFQISAEVYDKAYCRYCECNNISYNDFKQMYELFYMSLDKVFGEDADKLFEYIVFDKSNIISKLASLHNRTEDSFDSLIYYQDEVARCFEETVKESKHNIIGHIDTDSIIGSDCEVSEENINNVYEKTTDVTKQIVKLLTQ